MTTPSDDSPGWTVYLERHAPPHPRLRKEDRERYTVMAPAWRPDVRTIEWALSVIDEEAVGRMVSESLSNRGGEPGAPTLGEIAVESVLLPLVGLAQAAQTAPLPIDGGPGGSQ